MSWFDSELKCYINVINNVKNKKTHKKQYLKDALQTVHDTKTKSSSLHKTIDQSPVQYVQIGTV